MDPEFDQRLLDVDMCRKTGYQVGWKVPRKHYTKPPKPHTISSKWDGSKSGRGENRSDDSSRDALDQARMREAGNRDIQISSNKLLSNSLYNILLTSGNDDEELLNTGNQESECALNEAVAPRQRNEEDTIHLIASSLLKKVSST